MQTLPIRILLAEDNPDHAELTMDVLRENNVLNQITHVTDGEIAIEHLSATAADQLPDLVLLDIKMPRMSGIDVLRWIKNNERYKHIPTVMLSTTENTREIKEAYSIGANSFVSKPVEFETFVNIVSSLNYYWTITSKLPTV